MTECEESPFKDCTKRSVIYQTWCKTCLRKEEKKKDIFEEETVGIAELFNKQRYKKENDGTKKRKMMYNNAKEKKMFMYIGETSRSAFEHGSEHQKDLKFKRYNSQMLKHAVNNHPDRNPDHVQFGMKIMSSHQTAFERQI